MGSGEGGGPFFGWDKLCVCVCVIFFLAVFLVVWVCFGSTFFDAKCHPEEPIA